MATVVPANCNVPTPGRLVRMRLCKLFAADRFTASAGSEKPKSPSEKVYAVSSRMLINLSVPDGASFTDLTVMLKVPGVVVNPSERV